MGRRDFWQMKNTPSPRGLSEVTVHHFSFVLIGQHWSQGMILRRFFPKVECLWGYRQRISVHLPKAARENRFLLQIVYWRWKEFTPPRELLFEENSVNVKISVRYNRSWAQSSAILSVSLRSICFRLPNSATPYGLMELYYIIFKRNALTYFIVADYFKKKKFSSIHERVRPNHPVAALKFCLWIRAKQLQNFKLLFLHCFWIEQR